MTSTRHNGDPNGRLDADSQTLRQPSLLAHVCASEQPHLPDTPTMAFKLKGDQFSQQRQLQVIPLPREGLLIHTRLNFLQKRRVAGLLVNAIPDDEAIKMRDGRSGLCHWSRDSYSLL